MPDNTAGNFIDGLSNGDKAILGGSLVVFVSLFLPWYGWDLGILGSESVDGFHSWGLLTFIAWLAVVALWLLRGPLSEQLKMGELGLKDGQLYMILGGVEVLGAVLFWLAYNSGFANAGVRFGDFIGLVGGAVTIFGGYTKQSEPARVVGSGNLTPPGGYGTPPPGATPPPPPPSYGTPPPPPAPPSAPAGGPPPAPPPA